MDKIIEIYTSLGKAEIIASTIDGFVYGSKKGSGYIIIRGVSTPIREDVEKARAEWKEWVMSQTSPNAICDQSFEFKDAAGDSMIVRLSDIEVIRMDGYCTVVYLNNGNSIRSNDSYGELCKKFDAALKS